MEKLLDWISHLYKSALLKLTLVLITIVTIGFLTVDRYGISWDELVGLLSVKWNIEVITKGKPIKGIFEYDGTFFNFASEAVYQVRERVDRSIDSEKNTQQELVEDDRKLLKKFQTKHAFTFFTSLLAYLSVAGLTGILCGFEYAWLGPLFLAFFPRFWGHSFFNFKDIPFAALFTLATLTATVLVAWALDGSNGVRAKKHQLGLLSVLYGILIGFLAGIRLGGVAVITFPFIAYAIVKLLSDRRNIIRDSINLIFCPILALASCLLTTIACYPLSWSNPIAWLLKTLNALSDYAWRGNRLFNGQLISDDAIPWNYIPTWFIITVPVVLQITFLIGLVLGSVKYFRLSTKQQACFVLVVLQIFLLPAVIVIRDSVIYDEIRHILFVMPGVAVLSVAAVVWIYEQLPHRTIKLFAATLIVVLFAAIRYDMANLHPYEYLYFNRISGGLKGAYQQYDTDYWGLSMREAMEWINTTGNHDLPVLIGGPVQSASVFAAPDIKYSGFTGITAQTSLTKPFYYLAVPSVSTFQYQNYYQECKLVYQVTRQSVPLTTVRQCN